MLLHCSFNFLFCVVSILCMMSLLCGESFNMNKCVETEKQALLKFKKDALIFGSDSLSSWKGEDCCEWEGILCDNFTRHVTGLNLFGYGLRGKLNSSICELQHLSSLNLGVCYLEGKIPKCIGSLVKLIELNLTNNYNLGGVIPPSMRKLSNLQTLDLSGNKFGGVIPSCLTNLSNLQTLDLSDNNFVGVIPSFLTNLPNLQTLDLSGNHLDGDIPSSLRNLSNLQTLDLSINNLVGVIPSSLRNLSNLQTLDLSNNNLVGVIPSSMGNLFNLQTLLLTQNHLIGVIPSSLGNISNLQTLVLSHNNLVGVIPSSMRNLSNLQIIDFSYNNFMISNDLKWLSHLSNLRYLDMSYVNLTLAIDWMSSISKISSLAELYLCSCGLHQVTPIPLLNSSNSLTSLILMENNLNSSILPWIFNFNKLNKLDLSYNQLNGPLPNTIGQLSGLGRLFLSSNRLNSIINETHLSNLSQLSILDVSQNSISFNLSSDWIPPFKLESLYASSCTLGPKFPKWLKHLGEISDLDISNSGILDSFPEWFWNLSKSLRLLNVSHNKLNGPLPKSFPSRKANNNYTRVWDFSFNSLNGSLPTFLEMEVLFLSNNMFTGSLSSFCTSSSHSLQYLDLSSNLLAGQLSDCWRKFEQLGVLNLANNSFSGKVPISLGSLQYIESLHLNNNNFTGEIPSLILCHNLELIDVGDNNLQGTLPMWIGNHLHQLIVLRVRANKFEGNIPTSMCNLLFLQVLDISINNITGEIPQCLSNILALSNLTFPRISFHHGLLITSYGQGEELNIGSFNDKAILAVKGSNREYETNLGLMTTIDLSCNQLTGEIPLSITKLVALFGLNLSKNNLTGFIPNNIGHMQMLESLDLSSNHLHGKLPTSFSNLTFLSFMNLSFNNLEGKIPLSTQLQSFDPSSFVGNDRLCGPPLVNLCPGDAISPTTSHEKLVTDEEEDKLITFGFYVTLGIGFFVGFWGVCGTLVIKTSWRHVYFKFFKNVNDWIHVTIAVFVNRLKRTFQVKE